ncbi:outer envelope protein 64, chloroplastic [Nymphaea colorata]|nr:outer envelope protein 64, chloroplastic [Nymphaea colorata]
MSSANVWVLLGLGIAGIILMSRRFKKAIKEDFGAFIERLQLLPPPQPAPPKAPHPLTGLSFAVGDIFDICGYVTGFGSSVWASTHEAATQTSPVVSALVEGGAVCVGKTVVDEMAYSISGENKHFDTPTNPLAPSRMPGGSSSGSAVAVAAGLVDFSLGTDTAGGVRIPGAFCGILGFRPSHGVVSGMGIVPVSPSLDAVGWFAKDPSILRRVGHVLLQVPYAESRRPRSVVIADDSFELVKTSADQITQVVVRSTEKLYGRQVIRHINLGEYLLSNVPSLKRFQNKNTGSGESKISSLKAFSEAMLFLQRNEFKNNHLEWIDSHKADVSPTILSDVYGTSDATDECLALCQSIRNEARNAFTALLKDDGILVIPTAPGPPPKLGSKEITCGDYRSRCFSLLAIAGMSGCCQVTVPIGSHEKCPLAVSFVARHGGDRFLLDTVHTMYASLQEQASTAEKCKPSTNAISQEENAEIAKEKGNIAYKEKQWPKAISFYSEAIKLSGKNATYYSNRAAAYLELGSFLQAEADCSTAIGLDKKNVKAYLRRGTAREMLGYYKESMEDFRYALVLEPTNRTANLAVNRLKKLFQ